MVYEMQDILNVKLFYKSTAISKRIKMSDIYIRQKVFLFRALRLCPT